MIKYILIALVSLFFSFVFGAAAGYGAGYHKAFEEILPLMKAIDATVNYALKRGAENGIKATPSGSSNKNP